MQFKINTWLLIFLTIVAILILWGICNNFNRPGPESQLPAALHKIDSISHENATLLQIMDSLNRENKAHAAKIASDRAEMAATALKAETRGKAAIYWQGQYEAAKGARDTVKIVQTCDSAMAAKDSQIKELEDYRTAADRILYEYDSSLSVYGNQIEVLNALVDNKDKQLQTCLTAYKADSKNLKPKAKVLAVGGIGGTRAVPFATVSIGAGFQPKSGKWIGAVEYVNIHTLGNGLQVHVLLPISFRH